MSTEAGSQAPGGGAPWAGGVTLDSSGRPLDQIRLVGIAAIGHHGVFEHERREGQRFVADVVVHLDTRRAAAGDDLAHTLHYGILAEQVAAVLAGDPADLVETVAERIAATVLAFPQAVAVDVSVHKPQAPITVPFDDVVVTIHRDRTKLPAAEPYRAPAEASAPTPVQAPPTSTAAFPLVAPSAAAAPPPVAAATAPHPSWHEVLQTGSQPTADGSAHAPAPQDVLDVPPAHPVNVVIALGANQGSAQETLRAAVTDLARVPGLEVVDVSPLARTAAVGGPEQPDYLNSVVLARTTLAPRALLHATQAIEQAHGRERSERWGPRTLDIDLIVVGSTLAVTDDLELPHPRAHARAFVLQPWAQVDPDAVLPGLGGGPVAALAATAPDRDGIRWLALDWLTAPVPAPQPEPQPDAEQGRDAGPSTTGTSPAAHGQHPSQHPAGDWRA